MTDLLDVQNLLTFTLSAGEFIRNLTVALLCGLLITRFYEWANGRPNHPASFINSLVILTMITALIIMVIGNNLARAFGLVGAMSIIRFRTAVKDVQDIVFIFFSLAIGMAAGISQPRIAFIGTVGIGLVTLGLGKLQTRVRKKREYLLQFFFSPTGENGAPYLEVFNRYCKQQHLINMKSYGENGQLELSFYVQLKDQNQSSSFIGELGQLEEVQNVNLLFDEEYA